MHRVSAKFVLRLLTGGQKQNRVEIRQGLLANANGNGNFLKNIITGDETWVYECDVEIKMQPSQWRGKGSHGCVGQDQGVGYVFDWNNIGYREFVPRGQMVHTQLYKEGLARFCDAVWRKWPELWKNRTWKFHQDKALAQASLLIRRYQAKHQTSVVSHPPHSPGLAPVDFVLFPNLKTTLKDVVSKPQRRFRKMRQENCAPSHKVRCRKQCNSGRNVGNGISAVEGTDVMGTVLKVL